MLNSGPSKGDVWRFQMSTGTSSMYDNLTAPCSDHLWIGGKMAPASDQAASTSSIRQPRQ